MNVYTTDKIRNVALFGHGGCGKTSLVEAMAYLSGLTTRMGKVADGNTISDYDKEETKHQFSINASVVPILWEDTKINILDTPGYFDFAGEVEEIAAVADAAIIVVSGKAGIEVGTKRAWEICEKYKLPRMVFVTDMDIDEASYRQVVEDLQELYGKKIAPFHLPIRENGVFVGYVNVLQQRAKRWKDNGEVEKTDVPDYSRENLETYREELMEAVAETSEEFMERYFGGEEFSEDEIRQALRVNVADGSIVPYLGEGRMFSSVSNKLNTSSTVAGVSCTLDYNTLDYAKGIKSPAVRYNGIWWNSSRNEGEWVAFNFSTEGVSGSCMKMILSAALGNLSAATIVAPLYWDVSYSLDGSTFTRFDTVPIRTLVYWAGPQWYVPGLYEVDFDLPSACFGQKDVTIRLQAASKVCGSTTGEDNGTTTKTYVYFRFGDVSVKYF